MDLFVVFALFVFMLALLFFYATVFLVKKDLYESAAMHVALNCVARKSNCLHSFSHSLALARDGNGYNERVQASQSEFERVPVLDTTTSSKSPCVFESGDNQV